ncbi:MAG: sugar transferase [Oscillospiraceae bacterium]|nr:sugar transferase [Oscillospiraceae bacterium]
MYIHIKRVLDFIAALFALIILSPVMLIVAVIIKLTSEGPVIFKQERIGKDGKVFLIYKFRSMCVGAEKTGSGVYSGKGDARVTKIGKIIRATSIDELPQLVNIIKGEMSFIGPRPPLTYHPWDYSEYTDEQLRMFCVRPGITGWAQVNGRKGVEWNHRIELSVWYVDNISLFLDIKIFFMTIFKVFTNADNENVGETVAKEEDVKEEEKESVH